MKAAILHNPGTPLSIEDVEVAAPGPREVLIRTRACGACHSDLHFVDGAYPTPLPAIPGHEAAGVVEAVGGDVTALKRGDHVVTCFSAYCGRCEYCVTGRLSLCVDASTRRRAGEAPRVSLDGAPVHQLLNVGGYAETLLVHENGAVAIPPEMPFDRAALMGCAVVTGAGAILNTTGVRAGEDVAVIGCGGIGLAAVNAARIAGARHIVAVDPVPAKRALAERLGATAAFPPDEDDLREQVVELTRGGVHHAIEAVGRISAGELALSLLRRGGTATIVGMMPLAERLSMGAMDLLAEKKLQGCLMGSNRFPLDIPRLVDFYLAGRLDLDALVAERIGLADINAALDSLRTGEAARSVVVFD
ncbi:MAG: Zn-dependent alcohol dehydrogenase [Alphaproteobacteria bacterium]|nr:Zn-dependent alcohol dehydrogenase [Alphaproteobacteria bacterium]MBV9371541.1 Zn-dependent alcohol dehydrogenase [Alphaproteobacteria bacterium]MBV9902717.1 Zn-dependent alcohol dehydrogenase [Alphaproteobacteria bacterium]